MNDVRVFRREIINRAGRRRRQTRLIIRSRLHSGQVIPRFLGPEPQGIKTIVQRESRHWMHTMNGRPPFRPDRDLLLWRDS